jgi:YidC/Oxa1 family membrane protein insertase
MPSQTRNYVLFFLSFILIYAGYFWVRNQFWPPPKRLTSDEYSAVDRAGQMLAAHTGNPGDAARLAVAASQVTTSPKQADEFLLAQRKEQEEKLAAAKAPEPPPPEPANPADLVTLGEGENFNLKATLTNRGAGIHHLILTNFDAADWFGRPAMNADKVRQKLELIPPIGTASFAIYHYASADKEEPRPIDTLGRRDWQLVEKKIDGDEQRAVYATEMPDFGVRLVKTFTLKPREYHLGLSVRIERLPGADPATKFRYQLVGVGTPPPLTAEQRSDPQRFMLANKRAVPIEGGWYTAIFRNALFNWVDEQGGDERNLIDSRTIALKSGSDRFTSSIKKRFQYGAVANQFFTSAIVIDDEQPKRDFVEFARATVEGELDFHKQQLDDITVRAVAEAVEPKADAPVEHKYLLYHGPVKVKLLEQLDKGGVSAELAKRYTETLHLNTLTDYGSFSNNSFFSFWTTAIIFFTNVVHSIIGLLRKISPNDAICIILVTVLVRLAMLPLSRKQAATMAKTQEGMAKIKPELAKIKERFKNDLVAQQQAQMELYRKNGINPAAGLGGCLMLFLQMPIFLGLYFALQESFLFRLEPFLWIRNLTAPDMLFWWTEKIPYLSDPEHMGSFYYLGPFFNLLPIVALALMFFQMKYMQPPPADEQMAQQQKMMQYVMIPMFAFLFYKMASGLCLYFIATTLWGLAERKFLPKKKPPSQELAVGPNGRLGPAGKGKGKGQPAAPPPGRLKQWWLDLLDQASKDPTQRRRKKDDNKRKPGS